MAIGRVVVVVWALLLVRLSAGTWEGEALSGKLVRDPANKQQIAAEVWGEDGASVAVGKLSPGLYQVVLNGRFRGEPNARYSLGVSLAKGEETLAGDTCWPLPPVAVKAWQAIPFTWIVREGGTVTLQLKLADHAREEDAKAVADAKLRSMQKPELGAGDGDEDEFKLEDRPLPQGSESFLLRSVTLEPLPAPLVVTRVWPDKLNYFPEEKPQVEVSVWNPGTAPATGKLAVELRSGLATSRELLSEQMTVPPGETVTRTMPAESSGEYGYEVAATITPPAPGQPHTAREFFSVSENVFEVSIQGWGRIGVCNDQESMRNALTMPQEELDAMSCASAMRARRGYYNHVEFFSWAPDDFFNLSPAEDAWWSGTMTYIKVKRDILAELRALQAQGIKVLAYAQPYAIGLDTQRTLRTNPEFFAYGGDGAPSVSYDYDILKSRARLDMGLRPRELGGGLNFFDLRTVDRGTQALIDCWKMFGFDGVRYDNRYYRANNPVTMTGERAAPPDTDLDPYSARNVKRQKELFRQAIGPRWLMSHNNGYRFHTDGNKLGWEETVKGGLMCMDEETCNADSPASNLHDYLAYARFGLEARRYCTELGGYYQLFPPGRANTPAVDMAYYIAACAATGSHPITCDVENSPSGHYGRFLTRYSEFIFARDIKPMADAASRLALKGLPEDAVWWQDFANVREADGKRWLLFPLLVGHKERKFGENRDSTLSRPPDALTAVFTPEGEASRRYWLLSPELPGMALEFKPPGGAGSVTLNLPRLSLFGLLVVEEVAR